MTCAATYLPERNLVRSLTLFDTLKKIPKDCEYGELEDFLTKRKNCNNRQDLTLENAIRTSQINELGSK